MSTWFRLAWLDTHKSRIWLLRKGDLASFWNYKTSFFTHPIPNYLHRIKKERSICHRLSPLNYHLCPSMLVLVPDFCDFSQLCPGFWDSLDGPVLSMMLLLSAFRIISLSHFICMFFSLHGKKTQTSTSFLVSSFTTEQNIYSPSFPFPCLELEMLLQTFMCSIVENHEQKSWLWIGKVWAESLWIMTWRSHCTKRTEATQASGEGII